MGLAKVDLGLLQRFDGGRIAAMLDEAMKKATLDCQDRPYLDKKRTITMRIEVEPVRPDHTGELVEMGMTVKVHADIPRFESRNYSIGIKKDGTPFYSVDSPTNVAQTTLLPDDPPAAE